MCCAVIWAILKPACCSPLALTGQLTGSYFTSFFWKPWCSRRVKMSAGSEIQLPAHLEPIIMPHQTAFLPIRSTQCNRLLWCDWLNSANKQMVYLIKWTAMGYYEKKEKPAVPLVAVFSDSVLPHWTFWGHLFYLCKLWTLLCHQ